ncbi:hypothetical protein [Salipiger sp.]|uniref:hypothetical protein n=1 Tax=Salipiger sp. TaxID=2078585 RepID=UPI003A96C705
MSDAKSAGGGDLDLFGNPVLPLRDRRGRPSFAKTPENQDFVAVRAADGWAHSAIAEELGCDEKTLRKHFSRELKCGALVMRGLALDVLLKRLRAGHVPSVRALQAMLAEGVAAPAPGRGKSAAEGAEDGEADDETPTPRLGKKEQRLADADQPAPGYDELYKRLQDASAKGRAQ